MTGKYDSLEPLSVVDEFCTQCRAKIVTMAFKGTGVCCEKCAKKRAVARVQRDEALTTRAAHLREIAEKRKEV